MENFRVNSAILCGILFKIYRVQNFVWFLCNKGTLQTSCEQPCCRSDDRLSL